MKTTTFFSALFFASTILFAQTQTRNIDKFDGVNISGHYDLTLVHGSEGSVILTGDTDDLDKIETYVKEGELIIKQKKSSWFDSWNSRRVKISVPIEDIDQVVLSGSGSIRANHKLNADEFDIVLSGSGEIMLNIETRNLDGILTGSGDIELRGKTTVASFRLTGSGDIKASSFESVEAQARVTGSGDIEMHSSSKANANITGSGDIVCYGNPQIQQIKTTGSGDVRVAN